MLAAATAATTGVDSTTVFLAAGTILLGGVVATWIGATLSHLYDRRERFRDRRIAVCDDFMHAMNDARTALLFANGRAMKLKRGVTPTTDGDEAWSLMEECRFKIEEAFGHGTRLALVFPDGPIDELVQRT